MRIWLQTLLVPVLAVAALAAPPPKAAPTPAPEPIKFESFTFQNSQLPNDQVNNQVSGQVVIKNIGTVAVKNVEIVVHIQDGNHKDVDTGKQIVGTLQPNAEYTYDWNWRNYSSLFIDPLAEVLHQSTAAGGASSKPVSVTTRVTRPAAGAPVEGGSFNQPVNGDQPAPGMDATQTPPPGTPPGY